MNVPYSFSSGSVVYVTSGESVLHSGSTNAMPNCNHEEADTRIVVHMQQALQQGMRKIEVRTVDTDVVVILVGAFCALSGIQPLADLWDGEELPVPQL